MTKNSLERIKKKFHSLDYRLYWGDDYDVRFYLISKLSEIKNKSILDIGGGAGIITSELDKSNFCLNLDISYKDLEKCKNLFLNSINVLNASMINISLKEKSFDYIICAHVLEVAKFLDIENNQVIKNEINEFPTVAKVLDEIYRILKPNGILLLTTPNNLYYKSIKLTYDELKTHLRKNFQEYSLFLYNTYPHTSSKNRKLNMANVLPKIMSKLKNRDIIIKQTLIKNDNGINKHSVSFFVEAKKLK